MKHLLDIESLAPDDARRILIRAAEIKKCGARTPTRRCVENAGR